MERYPYQPSYSLHPCELGLLWLVLRKGPETFVFPLSCQSTRDNIFDATILELLKVIGTPSSTRCTYFCRKCSVTICDWTSTYFKSGPGSPLVSDHHLFWRFVTLLTIPVGSSTSSSLLFVDFPVSEGPLPRDLDLGTRVAFFTVCASEIRQVSVQSIRRRHLSVWSHWVSSVIIGCHY